MILLLLEIKEKSNCINLGYYIDDGYTGTNFNRPGFQKMIEDIDLGYISTVVVKDLSRLGRRYDTVGYYTDTYFPDRDVRFIAINDNVDDVYEKEGSSKHYTQRIAIYYRFVGYIEIPMESDYENYTADTRQGVEVEYIPTELFQSQRGKTA